MKDDAYAGYHRFVSQETGEKYGSFRVLYRDEPETGNPGWYWVPCLFGCLPDGDWNGPFDTSFDAYNDAQENA